MSSQAAAQFQCGECGRNIKWSPTIAGKMGRCKCGAAVRVPEQIEPPAQSDLDVWDALERTGKPLADASVAAPVASNNISYYKPDYGVGTISGPSWEIIREVFIPIGVVVLGYAGMVGWLAHHGGVFVSAVVAVFITATILMVAKTIALTLFALYLASKSGGNLGNPLTTILKIAGLVVALDAATMWAGTAMVSIGMITARGDTYGLYGVFAIIFDLLVVTFVVALIISRIAYGLHAGEARLFSHFVAGGNLGINILLVIILAVIGSEMKKESDAQYAAERSRVQYTPVQRADIAVRSDMVQGGMAIIEGFEWKSTRLTAKNNRNVGNLIDHLYNAGASKVYVQTVKLAHRRASVGPSRIFVELPSDPDKHAACCKLVDDFEQARDPAFPAPEDEVARQFLEIDLTQ